MKIPLWPVMQQQTARKWKQWETQFKSTCSSYCSDLQTTIHIRYCLPIKNGKKSLKKGWKVDKLEKRQSIFFKHMLRKKSQDCSEKSLDHEISLNTTLIYSSEKSLGVALVVWGRGLADVASKHSCSVTMSDRCVVSQYCSFVTVLDAGATRSNYCFR